MSSSENVLKIAVAVGGVVILAGCQSYEPRPLDLVGHREAFLARTPAAPEVAAFAASLDRGTDSAGAAFDVSDGMTLPEAETVALVFNADLRIARLKAGVTRATADNAGQWDDPTFSVDLTRIIESVEHPWKLAASVGLTLPISGRLEIEKQRASLEHAAELARVAQAEWQVRMDVRRAWVRWSAMRVHLEATREFLERVGQVLSIVDKMEAAGEMPRIEARLFRIERATMLAESARLEAEANAAAIELLRLMGLAPGTPVRFVSNGIGAGSIGSDSESAGRIDDATARSSPRMIVAVAEYEQAERSLELAVRRQYPDLAIGPGYGREDGLDEVLLGLSMPVPVVNGNRQAIAEARAKRDLARGSAETALEGLMAEAHAARVRLRAATEQRQLIESEEVPLVDAQYADARKLAQLGEVNALVLLESLARQQDAKVRLIHSRRDEALAAIDLAGLIGPHQHGRGETLDSETDSTSPNCRDASRSGSRSTP